MGVDYYACENCGGTFPDCGTYATCEHGHKIGPCCFPKVNGRWLDRWPEDQMLEDHEDYGYCVKEAHCPVCAKGGNETQQLKRANELNARLVGLLESAARLLTGAQAADASIEQAWTEELDTWCRERDAALAENGSAQ